MMSFCSPLLHNSGAHGNSNVHITEAAHEVQRDKHQGFSFSVNIIIPFSNCTKAYTTNSSLELQFLWLPSVAFSGGMRHCSMVR